MKSVPNTLVSVDPGLRACGVAVFVAGKLTHATLLDNPVDGDGAAVWAGMGHAVRDYLHQNDVHVDTLVIEIPQVYKVGKGDPGDLINLAAVVGSVVGGVTATKKVSYLPRQWKGNVLKTVHNTRTLLKLDNAENRAINKEVPNYLRHNVVDAIGLGLYELGR